VCGQFPWRVLLFDYANVSLPCLYFRFGLYRLGIYYNHVGRSGRRLLTKSIMGVRLGRFSGFISWEPVSIMAAGQRGQFGSIGW
jgi:hypothetical protein